MHQSHTQAMLLELDNDRSVDAEKEACSSYFPHRA